MTFVEAPKIPLYGQKVLCIDDEIYHEEIDRQIFTLRTGLYLEDLLFTDSFDSALELLEKHPEISIMIVDLRIPKNSQDYYDYNPENPGEEWGETLIKEVEKRYSKRRKITIIVISAYTVYSYTNQKKSSPVLAFLEKPIDYKLLIKNLESIINKDLVETVDYSSLSTETFHFIQERTEQIKKRLQRIGEDIIAIGNFLLEVKEKLEPSGQYLKWLRTEFRWSSRQARRYTSVARRFGDQLDKLSTLDIDRSAYWVLAETKTSDEVVEEVLTLAETGAKITPKLVEQVREKYLKPEPKKIKQSVSKDLFSESEESQNRKRRILPPTQINEPKPKQEILAVVPSEKAVKNSWWQLGEHNKLFCGEPKDNKFLNRLPKDIGLSITFLPKDDSLVPPIESIFSCTFQSKYDDLDIDLLVETSIRTTTKPNEIVVFNYLYYIELLNLAEKSKCHFIVAEPDLEKCERILTMWREKGSVMRIKN